MGLMTPLESIENQGGSCDCCECRQMIDCLIVGAGPVGLTLANLFCKYGVDFEIIDKRSGPNEGVRAVALGSRTVEVLEHLGLADKLSEQCFQAERAHLYSGVDTLAKIEFKDIPSHYNRLFLQDQARTEDLLIERLRESGKEVEWDTTLHSWSGNEASLRTHRDSAMERRHFRYLFGCDGSQSQVRRSGHIGFHGRAKPAYWLAAEVKLRGVRFDSQEPSFYLSDHGPVTFFPLGEQRFQVVTQGAEGHPSLTGESTFENFKQLVEERVPGPFEMEPLGEVQEFLVEQKQVDHLRYSSLILLGDAAHGLIPAYGQSINVGIQDAFNVAWKVAQVIHWKSSEKLLESITPERHSVAANSARASSLASYALKVKNPTLKWLRDLALETAFNFEAIQQQLAGSLSETKVSYRGSLLNFGPPSGPLKPGDRMPSVTWYDEEHRLRSLLSLFDDIRWSVVSFAEVAPRLGELQAEGRIRVIRVDLRAVTVDGVLVGPGKPLLQAFEGYTERLLVVRPDGHLAATFAREDHIEMANYLRPFTG